MAIRDLYISNGIKAITYTGDNLGNLLELQVNVNGDIQTFHYNINSGGRIPKNAWGLFEFIDYYSTEQSLLPAGYTVQYAVKATFIDHHEAPTSGWINTSMPNSYFSLANNYSFGANNFGATLDIKHNSQIAVIQVDFFSESYIHPFLSGSQADFYYEGPLLNFNEYVGCICLMNNQTNNFNSPLVDKLNKIQDLIGAYSNTTAPQSLNICDQATQIKNAIRDQISGKPMDRRQYALLKEAEDLFLEMLTILRGMLSYLSNSLENIDNCHWGNFSREVNSFEKRIYLQASGAYSANNPYANMNGIEGGIHLRWQTNLLTGRAFSQKQGAFNQPYNNGKPNYDDSLRIYRIPYNDNTRRQTVWTSQNTGTVNQNTIDLKKTFTSGFKLNFKNTAAFNAITPPPSNWFNYFNSYNDYIEIDFEKLCFAFELNFKVSADSTVKLLIETISKNHINNTIIISSREEKEYNNSSNPRNLDVNYRNENENITQVRVRFVGNNGSATNNATIVDLRYETYTDFYNSHAIKDWQLITKAVMSLNNNEVLNNRLSNSNVVIDKTWPKYKDNIVLVEENYKKKWYDQRISHAYKGLKDLVLSHYYRTPVTIEDDTDPQKFFSQSAEALLNYTAMDYHVARMLGLGHIDQPLTSGTGTNTSRYIYLAYYELKKNYWKVDEVIKYMTLPTGENDVRLPIKPEIYPGYGVDTGECEPYTFYDELGYSKTEKIRYVTLNKYKLPYEKQFETFFQFNEFFNLGKSTMPILFGVKHTNPSPTYQLNEITNNEDFYKDEQKNIGLPNIQVRETVPLINKENPLFVQKQTMDGSYEFMLYSINWFSRTSEEDSNPVIIDTNFENHFQGLLKPPSDIHVHYIQEEEALLFSTQAEQNALAARTGDKVWTRLTFNWNHIQKISQQRFSKLLVYYRPNESVFVRGEIKTVTSISIKECEIEIKNFNYNSTKTLKTSNIEAITETNKNAFVGALLKTENYEFEVKSIQFEGENARVRLKGYLIESVNEVEYNNFQKTCTYKFPSEGDYFSLNENWTYIDPITKVPNESWQKLESANEIPLTDLDINNQNTEIINNETYYIGGILRNDATFSKYTATSSGNQENDYDYSNDDVPLYFVTFNATLPSHTRSDMSWNKGILRIYNPIDYFYYDYEVATFENLSNTQIKIGIFDQYNYLKNLTPNSLIQVNYHPSYKVYLKPETASGRLFNSANILPARGERVKQTYIAIQSVYENNGLTQYSALSTPIPLIALEDRPVVKPEEPVGSMYAARPNFFKKSSYTFDSKLSSNTPYSFIILRATGNEILKTIYQPDTIQTIIEEFSNPAKKAYFNNFISDLANGKIFNGNGYKSYGTSPNIFTAPRPDNIWNETIPDISERSASLINELNQVFNPITTNPIVLSFFKKPGNQTRNVEPTIKDKNGEFLDKDDDDFDPYPFAVKFNHSGNDYLRFTDYKLEGNSEDTYFYSICELGINNKISERSNVLGPIYIINSIPLSPPTLKNISINPAKSYLNENIWVSFLLNKITDLRVNKILVYRTFVKEKCINYKERMTLVGSFNTAEDIVDTFNDYTKKSLPINETCYYRIVTQKTILNEFNESEQIDSEPSEVISITLFDNINPDAPILTSHISGTNTNNDTLNSVTIQFNSTMYKGKYYLYTLNSVGNWQLINTITNANNLSALEFNIGNVIIKENESWIYPQYKVVAENCSGLLSLNDNILNLTSVYVPNPSILGSKVACINQNVNYKTLKSKSANTIQWKEGNTNKGTTENQIFNWSSIGDKTITLIETDSESNISVTITFELSVRPIPSPSITGPGEVWCETEINYSTTNTNGNFYLWEVSDGEIIDGQYTNNIQIKWITAGDKTISVQESNGGCIIKSSNYNIVTYPKPNPSITGANICCTNQVEIYDLIYNQANNISINVLGGQFTQISENQIEVIWQEPGVGLIELHEFNNAGETIGSLQIDVKQQPNNNISGNLDPNLGTSEQYSIINFNPENTYTWNIDPMFGTNLDMHDNIVEVMWNNGGITVLELIENNGNCSVSFQFTIKIT